MAAEEVSSGTTVALSNLPATPRQRRLILVVAILLFATFVVTAPFVAIMLPQVRPFIPTVESIIFVNDLITSILLFSQFTIVRSRGLLALASGYLYSALIIIPHLLSYPGVFAESGVLGGGTQTTAYLYIFWHVGSAAAILAYAYLKDEYRPVVARAGSSSMAIYWSEPASEICTER
jgi:two-component system, sensor histidine kinase and response regulator